MRSGKGKLKTFYMNEILDDSFPAPSDVTVLPHIFKVKLLEFFKLKGNIDYNTTFNYLVIVMPIFLMLYPTTAITFIDTILIVLTFFKVKKDGLKYIFLEKYILAFLLGIGISFIGTPYSIKNGVFEIFDILQWIFFPLMIGQFDLKENTKRSFVKFLFIGLIVYAIRFYMHITGIITRPIYSFNRYSGGYILSQMSLILASIFVFLFIFFLYGKLNKKDKFYTLIFILLTFSLVLITKTRGIYLAIVITIPLILLMRNLEHFFVTILLSSIFLVVLSFSFPNNKYLKRFKAITRADISTMGRIEVWNESFRIFKENIINGVGYMNFKKAEKTEQYKYNNKHYVHSHSMYFKMLAETGIIGTITYLLLFGGLLIRAIKRRKEFRYLAIFSIISVLMLYELTEVFIWRNFAHALIFFTLSVLLNTEYQNSENHIKLGYKKA